MDDLFAKSIGEDAFQTVSCLQKYFVVLNENEQHCAIVLVLLSHLPRTKDTNGILRHVRVRLHLRKYRHHNLIPGRLLKILQLGINLRSHARIHYMGVVVKVGVGRRWNGFGRKRGQTPKPEEDEG